MVVPSIKNPFFTELVDQVEQRLATDHINLYVCDARDSADQEATRLKSLSHGAVDGLLVVPVHPTGSEAALQSAGARVPLVQLDRRVANLRIPWVGVDDRPSIKDLVNHLVQQGARSLAVFTSTHASLSTVVRTSEVAKQAKTLGVQLRSDHILDVAFSIEEGATAADRLLATAGPLPDAVICVTDILAIGAASQLRRRGVRVPDDIMITGFDDIQFASVIAPTLTTIRQPIPEIAAEGVRLLKQRVGASGIRIAIPGILRIRESTMPAAGGNQTVPTTADPRQEAHLEGQSKGDGPFGPSL